ncbi:MAG: hypothetical protein Q8Q09_11005 [Deltaproteobacteria bacterium]|nr:hypothetical protein [Deltaproteobacteria bacterium]
MAAKKRVTEHPLSSAKFDFIEDASAPSAVMALHMDSKPSERYALREVAGTATKHALVRIDAPESSPVIVLEEGFGRSSKLIFELDPFVVVSAAPVTRAASLACGANGGVLEVIDVARGVLATTLPTPTEYPWMVLWKQQRCIACLLGNWLVFYAVVEGHFLRVARVKTPARRGKWGLRLWCVGDALWVVDHNGGIRCYRVDVSATPQ